MPTAYIASPLGFSAATRGFYDDVLLPALRRVGIEPLDPWADPYAAAQFEAALALPVSDQRIAALRDVNKRLGRAHAEMIERADGLFAVLDGVDVDSGTAAEIGFAAANEKPIVGLRLDVRESGDNEGAIVNLQVQHFIASTGGAVLRAADTGEDALRKLNQAVELLARLVTR